MVRFFSRRPIIIFSDQGLTATCQYESFDTCDALWWFEKKSNAGIETQKCLVMKTVGDHITGFERLEHDEMRYILIVDDVQIQSNALS